MRNGLVDYRNLDEILLCILNTLLNSYGNLIGLAETVSYDTILISDNNDGCETEMASTLGNLGYPLY